MVLEHTRWTVHPGEEPEQDDLGDVAGSISVRWTGQGPLRLDRTVVRDRGPRERFTFVGVERLRAATVDGDIHVGGRPVAEGTPWGSYLLGGRDLFRSWARTDG